jgi:hypothetical protein
MRSKVLTLAVVLFALASIGACKKRPVPTDDQGPSAQAAQSVAPVTPVATPPPVIILLDAAPTNSAQNAAAMTIVARWSAAHQKGDAQELQALFAPKVFVNGTTVNAADHVKKTLHRVDPDHPFSTSEVQAETTADGKETYARFNTRIAGDPPKEAPKLIIVRDGSIVEDSDDPPDWCINKDKTTNGKTHPGFKLSASSAVAAVRESKHFAEIRKRIPHLGSDLFGFGCAKRCAVPRRECGYHFRLSDMEDTTEVIEWVYVDPVTKTLWWQEKDWISEQLR